MGKKSRNPAKAAANSNNNRPTSVVHAAAGIHSTCGTTNGYPSDGPSQDDECYNVLQTSSASLQAKLDQLTHYIAVNDRASFVANFVPLDLSEADAAAYLADLTMNSTNYNNNADDDESEGQWRNLAAEIAAIGAGRGVTRIGGDQVTRAVFFFEHPLLQGCDREVTFVCSGGGGEWRAEG